MAFLRFTRDKRGYEQFALVHPTTNRRGKTRTRVLYWYRTPPEIKVGREPFDESMRRALEAQNPDVIFDWKKILETPIPSAETERWRERRRAEKAEKAARRAEAAAEAAAGGEVVEEAGEEVERAGEASAVALERGLAPQRDDSTSDDQDEGLDEVAAGADRDSGATPESVEVHADIAATQVGAGSERPTEGHRRRRRRGRRGQPGGPPGMPQAGLTVTADAAAVPQVERSEPVEHRELSESGSNSEPRESE